MRNAIVSHGSEADNEVVVEAHCAPFSSVLKPLQSRLRRGIQNKIWQTLYSIRLRIALHTAVDRYRS
jgi:hypothetical protein